MLELSTLLFGFILPQSIAAASSVSIRTRRYAWAFATIVSIAYVLERGMTVRDLGIRIEMFTSNVLPYVVFTAVGLIVIALLAHLRNQQAHFDFNDWHFLGGFIIVSALQEFGYRAVLVPLLFELGDSVIFVICANAVLFALLHAWYHPRKPLLILAFLAGFAFISMYLWRPDLILITLSHAVLNIVAVGYGFFRHAVNGNLTD